MFQHILVPTDFSEGSKHALDIAANIAMRDKRKISLLHVIETIAGATFEEFESFYTKLEARTWDVMHTLMAPFQDGPVKIEPRIVYGDRTEQILKFASDNQVDLIVMISHKIRPQQPIQGWGTISYKVGVLSQCPVMLVK